MPDNFGLPSFTPTSSYGSTWGTGNGLAAAASAGPSAAGGSGMWIAAAGSILGSLGSSGAAKKQSKQDFKNQKELNIQEAMLGRQNSQFDAEQDYYYKQLKRAETSRGLAEYRKFSTVSKYAPEYQNTMPAPVVPVKPNANAGMETNPRAMGDSQPSSGGKDSWHGFGGVAGVLLGH